MGRYLMDKAFDMIRDLVTGLTGILVGVIGLGVVAGIVFDNNACAKTFLLAFRAFRTSL